MKRFRKGFKYLVKVFLDQYNQYINGLEPNVFSNDLSNVITIFVKCLKQPNLWIKNRKKGTLQEILQIKNSTMQKFYEIAYALFDAKKYNEAADSFFVLSLFNPVKHQYWICLGISEEKRNDYESAIDAYFMASLTDIESPLPHMHAAQCFYNINQPSNAIDAIFLAQMHIEKNKNFHIYKHHINRFKNRLLEL